MSPSSSGPRLGDQEARQRALDPTQSFIVQAPAGSGKTTLLTNRFLTLLTRVERPESVLAITFTQKAAAEMRARVLDALARAEQDATPHHANDAAMLARAKAVLAHARQAGWDLDKQPGRLRIQTIDSLNYWLADRLPVLSKAGVRLSIELRAKPLYREAAERTLEQLESPGALADALSRVLEHFDNEVDRLTTLLAEMLGWRERWLDEVVSHVTTDRQDTLRRRLECTLEDWVHQALARLAACSGPDLLPQLLALTRSAAGRLAATDGKWQALLLCPIDCPPTEPTSQAIWKLLGGLVFTADGQWRKYIGKPQGFLAKGKPDAERDAMNALMATRVDDDALREAWRAVMALPPIGYPEAEWQVVAALHTVLLAASQQLRVLFAERGQVDFVEVSQSALLALGSPEEPTDLTLALDERIEHLLVDEFQDTSVTQVRLLKQLTSGWSPHDGRTLFLVGDPMQSIYGFRAANISLFLGIQQQGLGALRPESLLLSANFRSRPALVSWFNQAFSRAFPATQDLERGAICYAPSEATRAPTPASEVHWRVCEGGTARDEAREALEIIRTEQSQDPTVRIAVLGRSRSQLTPIAAALRDNGIAFHGIDLVPLVERLAVRDLISLTRALLHYGDRIAWLACLRAPWCGVSLEVIEHLLSNAEARDVWSALTDSTRVGQLAPEDALRIERLVTVMKQAIDERGQGPLSACVERAWLRLGGPATLLVSADLDNARMFFTRLDSLERAGDLLDPAALGESLEDLYGAPDPGASTVQLLTIHRAKGLEWDVVILTGLARTTRASERHLLEWVEFSRADSETALLMAPHRARSKQSEALETWLRGLAKEREQYEVTRLFYVAATRAQERLYLVSHGRRGEKPESVWAPPAKTSLLSVVWSTLAASAPDHVTVCDTLDTSDRDPNQVPSLSRLPADFVGPATGWALTSGVARLPEGPSEFEFEWVTASARHVGSLVHEELERVARHGLSLATAFEGRESSWRHRLQEWGVSAQQLPAAIDRARRALKATALDPRGQWLFTTAHEDARSELDLSTLVHGRVVSARIDRTFIDEAGIRWIIDYKTSEHEGTDLDAFLDREQERYRAQLVHYAALLAEREPRRVIRLGLYFPLHSAWREWPAPTP